MAQYDLRGHHLRNLKLYLRDKNDNPVNMGYFSKIFSDKMNSIRIIDSNDPLCGNCDSAGSEYCTLGGKRVSKKFTAGMDRRIAEAFDFHIGDCILAIDVVEPLLGLRYLTGINPEKFFGK